MAETDARKDKVQDDVFDVERVRRLVELMKQHDLSEIDLRQRAQRIRLLRGGQVVVPTVVTAAAPAPVGHAAAAPPVVASGAAAAAAPAPAAAPAEDASIAYIRSPMVGTFYSKSNPNAEPYVRVGDHVSADKTVCIIEAMKVFNEIPAEINGRIVAILVEDEEPVDFGKPLFKLDTGK